MSLESEKVQPFEEDKDRTKWIWAAVAGLIVIMAGVMWWNSTNTVSVTSQAHVKHILIRAEPGDSEARARALEQITRLREQLEAGANFGKLAREYSGDPGSAERGGDLGWLDRGTLVEPMENYIWTGPLHEVSPVIETNYGLHLVVVEGREVSPYDRYEQDLHERAMNGAGDTEEDTP